MLTKAITTALAVWLLATVALPAAADRDRRWDRDDRHWRYDQRDRYEGRHYRDRREWHRGRHWNRRGPPWYRPGPRWHSRWHYLPRYPHRYRYRHYYHWAPGALGGAILGSALTYTILDGADERCDYDCGRYRERGSTRLITGCYRIERGPDGREVRVEVPLGSPLCR